MTALACFKAYDIRGRVPNDLDEALAYKIGYCYVTLFHTQGVIVGYDARLESPMLAKALIQGIRDAGARVVDIGLCGTEEVYFHTFHQEPQGIDGGIMITASHNPKGYNGMKIVQKGSRPVSNDSGLRDLHDRVVAFDRAIPVITTELETSYDAYKTEYVNHLLSYVDPKALRPLKIVCNPGNGTAGLVLKHLANHLPFELIMIQEQPDGTFPHGVPNPLLEENRFMTRDAVLHHQADFGIAFDGDFDRCFFFDEKGDFIEGYYIVGLLAQTFLLKQGPQKIIHDPRLTWNTIDLVQTHKGEPIVSKTGHAFIKERMRQENAIYGVEMSAHHYFRDFAYCDSGMIPWLLIAELISIEQSSLSTMMENRMKLFPCSGEINYTVTDAAGILQAIESHFMPLNPVIDKTDGLSMAFDTLRFNIRCSNTEPLLRLNIESRGCIQTVKEARTTLERFIVSA